MIPEYTIDWRKSAQEIQDDFAAVCRQRDELVIALEMIAWSNDSEWQADCAKEVLARVKEGK